MSEAYIIEALRTPIGRKNGGLSGIRADDLAALPLRAIMEKTGVDPQAVDDVVMGCVTQVGEQGINIARIAGLIAGLPQEVPGTSVNRMCGSSQQAMNFAAMGVKSGAQDLVLAAGVESMSRVAMASDMMYNGDVKTPSSELSWRYSIVSQGVSAEIVAEKYGLSRATIDAFSLESHRRAAVAQDARRFQREIIPVQIGHNGDSRLLTEDEGIRRDTTLEKLAGLRAAFKDDGVISAGSSSQISDGAAAVLVASEQAVKTHGLKPRARIVAMVSTGVDPTIMLTGPIPASRKALQKAGLSISDMDVIEINEAFASVPLATIQELGMDPARVNINGGAIALGHPLGASGARLIATALAELERTGGRYALTTMCIGFGQGIATIIERL